MSNQSNRVNKPGAVPAVRQITITPEMMPHVEQIRLHTPRCNCADCQVAKAGLLTHGIRIPEVPIPAAVTAGPSQTLGAQQFLTAGPQTSLNAASAAPKVGGLAAELNQWKSQAQPLRLYLSSELYSLDLVSGP